MESEHIQLINVGGRTYRKYKLVTQAKPVDVMPSDEELVYQDDGPSAVTCTRNPKMEIQKQQTRVEYKAEARFAVIKEVHRFIIGKGGLTRNRIQREHGVHIIVPDQRSKATEVLIKGPTELAVTEAKQQVLEICRQAESKIDYTHFLGLPLTSNSSTSERTPTEITRVQQRVAELATSIVTEFEGSRGVDETLFQKPTKLHLTLLMLRVYTQEARDRVVRFMNDKLAPKIYSLFTEDDRVVLNRLNYMNDDPSDVNVVYAELADNATKKKILQLIDFINTHAVADGLATERDVERNTKLHVTLINSKFRPGSDTTRSPSFDATGILNKYKQHCEIGSLPLRTLELSVRTVPPSPVTGYYVAEHSIAFPL